MDFRVEVDVRRLVKAYETAPDETTRQVRLWLKSTAEEIKDYASNHHRYTTRTGMLERRGIRWNVDGTNLFAVVEVEPRIKYGIYIHQGYKAFDIVPKNKKVLRWANGANFVFAKKVHHPAWEADPFLYNAAEAVKPSAQKELQERLDRLFRRIGQ